MGSIVIHAALLAGAGSTTAHAQSLAAGSPGSSPAKGQIPNTAAKPSWTELTADQKVALGPLAAGWSGLSEGHKRKWIALSQNFHALTPAERTTLHGRMTEWAALSPAQRSQARLNFAETQKLSTEDKKNRWQAYQALSAEQKKELASGAPPKAAGAALAATPVAPSKLAAVPTTRSEPPQPGAIPARTRAAAAPATAAPASAPVARP